MAISTKVITMRQGNKADYQASKMLAGELAVINDTEELHFSPKSGKSIRVATEDDLKELESKIPSGGGTFSGSAKDVTYDDSKTQLGATNVQDAIGKVSEQKVDNPSTGEVGQILEIESVDENGKPKTYKAVDKPTSSSGETGDGLSSTAITLLISILRNAVFATDQSGVITSLETILRSGSSSEGGDNGNEDDNTGGDNTGGETQEITATVEGSALILSNAPTVTTATVTGNVMTLV